MQYLTKYDVSEALHRRILFVALKIINLSSLLKFLELQLQVEVDDRRTSTSTWSCGCQKKVSSGYYLIAMYYMWANSFLLSKWIEKDLAKWKVLRFLESITLLRKRDFFWRRMFLRIPFVKIIWLSCKMLWKLQQYLKRSRRTDIMNFPNI